MGSPFVGDSEMARRMREADWAGTPLGPPAGWPPALRTATELLLRSQLPMCVAAGPRWSLLYNDAYAPLLGARHPDALAAAFGGIWPEVWPGLQPVLADALAGKAVFHEDMPMLLTRRGWPEEAWFTYSLSAIGGEGPGADGVFCACTETTAQVVGERRLRALGELAELGSATDVEAAGAAAVEVLSHYRADVPAALLYLLGDDGARLVAAEGVEPGGALGPATVADDGFWAPVLREVVASEHSTVVEGLAATLPEGRLPGAGPLHPGLLGGERHDERPFDAAVVLPVRIGTGGPTAVLVVGVSPYLPLDEEYRAFLELVGHHLSTAATAAAAFATQQRRAEHLIELNRAKTAFFARISDEFRTPLTLVLGPVAELRDAAPPGSDLRTDLELVHRNAQRLRRMVDRLLELSQLYAGHADPHFEPVDLAALTAGLAGMFRTAADHAGLTLELDCPDLGEAAFVDRSMWEQVVVTVLAQAVAVATTGRITVALGREGGSAVLRVATTGTAVRPPDDGVGPALVAELVGLLGGSVTVDPVPTAPSDGGTTVTVAVPLGRDHVPPRAPGGTADGSGPLRAASVTEAPWWLPEPDVGDPPSTVPPDNPDASHILVVDDHADMRAYLMRLLGRTHRVEAARDGAAALVAALADPPDLVLADVSLPGLSGLDLLTALRGDPRTSLVPVVLMSARAGAEAAVEGLGAGADDYLVTPFSARELRARVDGRVALGRARREAERRFRAMADSTPTLIWADGPGGMRLFVNRGWLEFTGAEPDADLGLAWQDRIHPADRSRYDRVRAAADGGPFEVEYRLRAADGHYRWVLDRGAPAEGYVGGYVGGCLDIDSRVGERERQRLLAVIGAALDRETTVTGRRQTLVRTLVDEGLADMARFVEINDGQATDGLAIAAHTPEQEAALRRLDVDWMRMGRTVTAGEVRQYDVDEAFILASSADERQQELRRSMRFGTIAVTTLSARGQTSGLLAVARTRDSTPFDEGDTALLADLAERAATALDNALLLEHEQANRARLEVLQRATAALSAAATPEQVAATAVAQFAGLAAASVVTLWLLTDVGGGPVLEPVAPPASAPGRRIAVGEPAPPAEAARTRGPVWAEGGDPGGVDCVPLVAAGRCVGVVGLGGQPRDVRTGAARAALTVLAKLCAQALQRAGLLAAESSARRTAEEFGEVVGALSGATRLVDVAEVVLDHTIRLGASSAAVLLRAGAYLDVLAARGTGAVPASARRLPMGSRHPAARVARTGEPLWEGSGPDAGTLVAVPLALGGPTRPTGAIVLRFADGRPTFSAQERTAVLTLAGQCAQALDRARLHQAEHDVADVLQRSLLPPALPPLPRLRVAERYLPSAVGIAAGGDWYDLLPIDEDRVAVVVGDVVGHGATAAAVMGQLRSALAAYLLDGHPPAAALERLDRFARRVPGSAGSTCVCLVVDCGTGALCWASAGHPPILLLEPAGPRYLEDGGGTVLGVSGRPPYRQADAVIEPGSSVLLYTDGLVERRGEVLDKGQERLARAAARVRDLPPDELVSVVVDTALADGALGDVAAPDDIAVVAVRLMPGPLHGVQPAQPRRLRVMRHAVEDWAAAVGLPDEVLDDLQYALGEAAANAVEHAYGNTGEGEFHYTLEHRPGPDGGIAVEVRDTGRWRPVPADSGHRGRGVAVLHAIGKDVHIDSGDGGTTVTFRVPVPPSEASRRPRPAAQARSACPTVVTAVPGTDPPLLRVSGDLDLDGVAAARGALLAAAGPAGLVVDLHDTGYVSSAGVALLVELSTRARAQGAPLALRVSAESPVARVLDLTGLREVLPVDP
ncbi:MAG: SpoIIE family protein phosphatase [Pseudonocardia sp.]|nr:SpoIIE family protein phosphatase [Pseudonocardia sp.]